MTVDYPFTAVLRPEHMSCAMPSRVEVRPHPTIPTSFLLTDGFGPDLEYDRGAFWSLYQESA